MTSERGANPSSTTGGQDLATLVARFVALLIDWGACLLLAYLLEFATGFEIVVAGANLVTSGLFAVYYTVALATGTQSLGMALMRIACVSSEHGGRLGFVRSLVRAVLLSLFLPALTAFVHPYHRGLHDLAAGSVMLKVG